MHLRLLDAKLTKPLSGPDFKIGVVYPHTTFSGSPTAARTFARTVEELGFDHLVAYDHVLGAARDRDPPLSGPYGEKDLFHDPLVLFGFLAAITTRIELATGVLVLPQRQTALVARQSADVDLLSGGKLRLGVGTGWNYVEYEALGAEFSCRGERIEEQVELLRRLWAHSLVNFHGTYHRVDRAAINPRPARSIPIWMGGSGSKVLRRAAAMADGFIFVARDDPIRQLEAMQDGLDQESRGIEEFGTDLLVQGGLSAMVRRIERWRAAGGTHVSVLTMQNGFATGSEHLQFLEKLQRLLRCSA